MHRHHTVVDLSPATIPLAAGADGLVATLGHTRLIHAADRLGMGVLRGHNLLASISELFFIPLDRFEKAL